MFSAILYSLIIFFIGLALFYGSLITSCIIINRFVTHRMCLIGLICIVCKHSRYSCTDSDHLLLFRIIVFWEILSILNNSDIW
jgi:predicted MFS family arabinose efflux permease